LAGEGEAGTGGAGPGDLYVEVQVNRHDVFTRDGSNLFCDVPISFVAATLGGELEVPTLSGKASLKVPEGTQSGQQFRLRGKGIKSVRGGPIGDLMCRVIIETPVKLSKKQKELLQEFEATLKGSSGKHSPKHTSWLDAVKQFFD
jgi:molecular chaperone DnaJ